VRLAEAPSIRPLKRRETGGRIRHHAFRHGDMILVDCLADRAARMTPKFLRAR